MMSTPQPPSDGEPNPNAANDGRKIVLPPGVTLPGEEADTISAEQASAAGGNESAGGGGASSEEVAGLQAELDAVKKEAEAERLRLRAEMENVRKRIQRTADDRVKYATEGLLRDLLNVADDFERALNAGQGTTDVNALLEGLRYVQAGFGKALQDHGVQPIATDGNPFDPNVHEAVDMRQTDEAPDNTVIATHRPGYLLHERLLRAAQVIVSKNADGAQAQTGEA